MTTSIVSTAFKHLKAGDYSAAHAAFTRAANDYGHHLFDYNVRLCERRMGQRASEVSQNRNENRNFVNIYFDHVYIVNLPHDVEKRFKVAAQMRQRGIQYELFNATNGYIGDPAIRYEEYALQPLGTLRRYAAHSAHEIRRGSRYISSAGAMGYIYTYLRILEDAKLKRYKRILILEDDVILNQDFETRLMSFIMTVGDDWKVLQLGASQYGWESVDLLAAEKDGFYFPRALDTCGSFAMAIDHTVIDALIEVQSSFEAPFDHLPMGEIYEKNLGKCFVAFPNIVMPDVSASSIRGGRCQYAHGEKMKWPVAEFPFPLQKPVVGILLRSAVNAKYLASFIDDSTQPYHAKFFYPSLDGLRPIHDVDLFTARADNLAPVGKEVMLAGVDYCATLDGDVALTETDIETYIAQKLGLGVRRATSLRDVEFKSVNAVPGRVSVIIPTYKRPLNLRSALTSVLSQDYPDIEVIVVSDNGTASPLNIESRQLVAAAAEQFQAQNVHFVEHSINRNGSSARNTGILRATGSYICFLDDDDVYLPGRISESISALAAASNDVGGVYCGFIGWNSRENDLNRYKEGDLTLDILMLDYKKHYLCTNTGTYKREAILALNGFDESFARHQDLEFNLRFFKRYYIAAVKECYVRLSPEPQVVDNKVYNRKMLDLKTKFLTAFASTIRTFDPVTQKTIYEKHWSEAARFINDREGFIRSLREDFMNGSVSALLLLHGTDQ